MDKRTQHIILLVIILLALMVQRQPPLVIIPLLQTKMGPQVHKRELVIKHINMIVMVIPPALHKLATMYLRAMAQQLTKLANLLSIIKGQLVQRLEIKRFVNIVHLTPKLPHAS